MVSGCIPATAGRNPYCHVRGTFDLGVARRLREMASELQTRAAEQEDERGFNELASFKRPVRIGT
jgi:hypothetical protein